MLCRRFPTFLLAVAALPAVTLAAAAPQAQTGVNPGDLGFIQNGSQTVAFMVDGAGAGDRYHALKIVWIEDRLGAGNPFLSLEDAPLWRLDFRKLDKLGDQNPAHNAPWKLIPSLDPLDNLPLPGGSTLVWADTQHPAAPAVAWQIPDPGVPYARLVWRNVPLDAWPFGLTGTVDVTLHLRLEPSGTKPMQMSLAVDTRLDASGGINGAILSVCFPDLMLGPLEYDPVEPAADNAYDDLLLLPWTHGYLVPDPISVLEVDDALNPTGLGWISDSNAIDFEPGRARNLTYPGDTCTQFLYYYDVDASAPFVQLSGQQIDGYGTRPSLLGRGPGIYLAAQDPDMNVKRIVAEGRDGLLRLALRTFVPFDYRAGRLASLKAVPPGGTPGTLWQSFYLGPDSPAATAPGPDLHFDWPVVMAFFEGDWVDAAEAYKRFFDRQSKALYRQGRAPAGEPVRLRDYPARLLPEPFKHLAAVVGLNEATAATQPGGAPIGGAPGGYLTAFQNLQDYLGFLRLDYQDYQNGNWYPDPPYYALVHSNGMYKQPLGEPVKSGGNDKGNNAPRPGLADLYAKARRDIGFLLTGQNRDHGSWKEDGSPVMFAPEGRVVRTETGQKAYRTNNGGVEDSYLVSYARPSGPGALKTLLAQSLDLFVPASEPSPDIPLDWYWISGQGSAVKPDYSLWFQPLGIFADPVRPNPQLHGRRIEVGGGSQWVRSWRKMAGQMVLQGFPLQNALGLPASADFFFSTERLSEPLLLGNVPSGHRRVFPVRWREKADTSQDRQLMLLAEPVGLSSFLFHDFALMRGEPHTFAQYYGLPMDDPGGPCPPIGSPVPPGFFDQSLPAERALGERFNYQMLAREVVYLGLLPVISVELIQTQGPGGWPMVCDRDGPGLDSLDDRLSTAGFQGITVGRSDLATTYTGADEAPAFLRRMFRARAQFREFFVGGRRIRDPGLINPDPLTNPWFAEDMQVHRWPTIDLDFSGGEPAPVRFTGGSTKSGAMPPMNVERLVVGTYMNFIPHPDLGSRPFRVFICVCNPSGDAVDYQMQFVPADWPLPPGAFYKLKQVSLDLSGTPAATGPFPGSQTTPVATATTTLASRDLHYWVLEIQSEPVPPVTPG